MSDEEEIRVTVDCGTQVLAALTFLILGAVNHWFGGLYLISVVLTLLGVVLMSWLVGYAYGTVHAVTQLTANKREEPTDG